MARIRSLKIGFYENEDLAQLPYETRLLFAGLWLLADREGRLEDRPLRIKARLFPYDGALNVDDHLTALHRANFILRYDAEGAPAIQVLGFAKHQRPKTDEQPSVIPAPLCEIPRGELSAPILGKGKDRETERQRAERDAAPDAPPLLAELWNSTTELPIPRCREMSTKRAKHIKARLIERPMSEWEHVFRRIQESAFCRGENDRGWRASFDWVIGSPDVAVKVLEGKYDDRTPRSSASRPSNSTPINEPGECPHSPRCDAPGRWDCIRKSQIAAMKAEGAA